MFNAEIPWPGNAKCAAAITFDCDADSPLHIAFPDGAASRVQELSWLRYDEVAVPRIVELFDHYDIKQTFFVPAWCLEQYPHAFQSVIENGHEIAAHSYLHESPNKLLTREAERYWLRRSADAIETFSGRRPTGFRAPGGYSQHTTGLLVEEGFTYDSSLMNDSVPFVLRSQAGDLIELPIDYAMDDWPQYVYFPDLGFNMQPVAPHSAAEVYLAEFDAAYACGSVWITTWHPMVSGRPARLAEVAKMIEYIQNKGDVWFATMDRICSHIQLCIDSGTYSPRVVPMPFYNGRVQELLPGHVTEEFAPQGGIFP